ncbi:MAG: hypothetical protein GTO63_34990, partial [Anaerolineae bacterium]|nr:hypothetical protein [Anaerolineae bacterium]NIN99900.1 hypothetical protein [Anaerolineae bacterium]NIQ82670.1 hypothetical protein [Anaerolineae bacterium]
VAATQAEQTEVAVAEQVHLTCEVGPEILGQIDRALALKSPGGRIGKLLFRAVVATPDTPGVDTYLDIQAAEPTPALDIYTHFEGEEVLSAPPIREAQWSQIKDVFFVENEKVKLELRLTRQ